MARIASVTRIDTSRGGPDEVTRQFEDLIRWTNEAGGRVLLQGVLLTGQTVGNLATVKIKHGLGFRPRGFFLTRRSAAGHLTDGIDNTDMPDSELWLTNTSSNTINFDVVIF